MNSVQQFFCYHLFSNAVFHFFSWYAFFFVNALAFMSYSELYWPKISKNYVFAQMWNRSFVQNVSMQSGHYLFFRWSIKLQFLPVLEGDKQEPCGGLSIESNRLRITTEGCFQNFINSRNTGLTAGQFRKATTMFFRMN